MNRKSFYYVAVMAIGLAMAGGSTLAGDTLGGTAIRPLPDPVFPVVEHSNLAGFTSDVTTTPANACFDGVPDAAFHTGEAVAVNVFWEDTIEADLYNEYDVTWGARLPNGTLKTATFACDYDVAGSTLQPGDSATFCCYLVVNVPPIGQTVSLNWGARSVKIQGGVTLQSGLGSITVGP